MPTSENGSPVPARRRRELDLAGIANSVTAVACSVYLVTRSVTIAVTTVLAAALLGIAELIRRR
jgi:hypothetical protein